MPETTEQQPANTKPKQSAYLVCEGALCTCMGSQVKAKLKVDSHKKAYINNNKLLATVKDVTFEGGAKPFKTCSLAKSQDKSCTPQFKQWIKPYKDIEVEGNPVITDQSQLLCLTWNGMVTIDTHGQQQTVNAGQAENMDRAIAAQVNPLADLAPLAAADKKVKVSAITGELVDAPKYKPVTTQKTQKVKSVKENQADKDPSDICVRPGQEIKFTAKYEGTEALVCWKIFSAKDPVYFLQHGSVYKTSFDTVGKYTIEGYDTGGDSNLDVDTQINKEHKRVVRSTHTECMLDILVQENKLTGIRHLPSENIVAGKVGDKTGVHVRIGMPVTFEPLYLMPPNQEEIDHLILLIKDASGNEVQRRKGSPNIIFAAQNSAAVYSVQAYFDNSEEKPFTYLFKTTANTISVIAASGLKNENDKIRPGTTLTFSVSKFKFESDEANEELVQAEAANIHWYDQSDIPVAIGKTTFSKTYQKEEKYIVTCVVKAKSAGWFALATNKDEADDWHFEVTRNYPTAIEQKTEGKVKVGKKVIFEMKSIFDVNFQDEGTIQWKLTGPESITLGRYHNFIFTPKQNGKYTLTVSMNGKSKELSFECITCEIVKGWWTDGDGNILTGDNAYDEPSNTIGFAGWQQEVVASFKHIGLKGEEVTLEVWDSDAISDTRIFTKDIKIEDDYNCIGCAIKLDAAIREKVTSLTSQGLLYFTVKAKNGLKLINDGMALPQSNDQYLQIDSRERAKVYFSDNNDTRRYTTAALDTPVYIQIKSTNLIGEELELEIWKSIEWGSDKSLGSRFTFKVDKYGMASLKLNMALIKPEVPTAKDVVRVYVKIYNKKTGKELISGEKSYKLTMYKTLATSASSIGTTKAFVMVDASKGEKREYCACQADNLIWGNKVSCSFRKKVIQICQELWPDKYKEMANGLMAVIKVETSGTFSPSKIELLPFIDSKGNKKKEYRGLSNDEINKLEDDFTGAVGLIQFVQDSIDAINKAHLIKLTKKKLALMKDVEQLDYVKKYLMLYGWHKKLKSPEDIYLHIFAPIGIAKDDNFELYKAYENPQSQSEIESNKNYLSNESVDIDKDKSIKRFEILSRYNISFTEGLSRKTKEFSCNASKINDKIYDPKGILTEMKKLVDTHVVYNQSGVRNEFSEASLLGLDCSETVAIYLYKLGITEGVKGIDTSLMTTEKDFRLAINSENIDFIIGSDSESFIPTRGDIFVWRTSEGGHTGIVFEYSAINDFVTILEAIGKIGSADEITNINNGGYKEKGCSRTAIYIRSGEALSKHAGWIGYFRPKNYSKKL